MRVKQKRKEESVHIEDARKLVIEEIKCSDFKANSDIVALHMKGVENPR